MKVIGVLAGAGLLAGLAAGPAAADTWSAAYGNTIVATYTDGRVAKVFVEPDHTYAIVPQAGGDTIHGTWADKDGQSCFTITAPAAAVGGAPACFPVKDYKVGDSFPAKDATGTATAVITAGR